MPVIDVIKERATPTIPAGQRPIGPYIASRRSIRRRRRRRQRRVAKYALVALAVLAGLSALALIPTLGARNHLQRARQAMEDGKKRLLAADVPGARQDFETAAGEFSRARGDANNPLLRLGGFVPLLGRTPDAVESMSVAGEDVAKAGVAIADGLGRLPEGLGSLAPVGGRIPLERFGQLEPSLARAAGLVDRATQTVAGVADSWLLGSVAEARREFDRQLLPLRDQLDTGARLVHELPAFLGQQGPKRYFFGAQNPAELRGTGGLIGAYSILTIDRGRFHFSPFRTTPSLPNFHPGVVPAPNASYAHNYNRFGGAGFWLNINMTPDFPSAALAIEGTYRKAKGVSLDGVVVADPFALADLLKVTGPVGLRSQHIDVGASNVVAYTTNQVYGSLPDPIARKLILGEVAKDVFGRFMSGAGSPTAVARALAEAVADGHLLVFSNDQGLQEGLARGGVAGGLAAGTGDFLSVVQNNAGANKADFFEDRSISDSVRLNADGSATAITTVTLQNNAPTTGQPLEVIGPFPGDSGAGENVSYLNLYCAPSCSLAGAELNGASEPLHSDEELGLPYFQDFLRIPSGHSAALRYELSIDRAWQGDNEAGVYRFTFLNQPTIRPTRMQLEIRVPDGMSIVETSVPMRVSGGSAVWEGKPGRELKLDVRFQRPFVQRVWHRVWRFLSKPVIRL